VSGKIIGSNGNVLFEFEEGQNLELLLGGLIQKAKFGERFDNDILANDWVNELLALLIKSYPDKLKVSDADASHGAPDYFINAGVTQKDWDLRDFFNDITVHLSQSTRLLGRQGWKEMNAEARKAFLSQVVFPWPISDTRLNDMIEDIDHALQSSASVYNPDYKDATRKS